LPKPLKTSEVWDRLRKYDKKFELAVNRGKGSHIMISHPSVNGVRQCCPVPSHKGKDVRLGILKQIIRRFDLPKDIFD
jgi:predicted RNA binding protein YcfA (HicA-like mRNA interferase family)